MRAIKLPSFIHYVSRFASVLFALSLVACATESQSGVVGAAATPLNDLNLVREKIPVILLETEEEPYAVPSDQSCASLDAIVSALDEVLEPDLDAPVPDTDPGYIERGSDAAGKAAVGTLRSTVEDIVPFRGWLRKLSGAERHSKQVAAALAAGRIRRAFIKGLRISKACPAAA